MPSDRYSTFCQRISKTIPKKRVITDELRTLAYGTDASFYRLIPKVVVQVENESEIVSVLTTAGKLRIPVTFRAAGTSLSGQSVTDSILVMLGPTWSNYEILDNGHRIRLQPGIVGATANFYLLPYGRKIGPDPASINSAMIGGIAANNASGMCCGTAANSYRTLSSMRIIFADGSLLDTGDPESRRTFTSEHEAFLKRVRGLSERIKGHQALADRIRAKFKMKNTTGYSLNALVDFNEPIDVIEHLMIGSEGTLGFMSEITYQTVPELPDKASSLMLFPDTASACSAVALLKGCPVDAVELMDRASLRSIEDKSGMPSYLKGLDESVASLLVETRADSPAALRSNIAKIETTLEGTGMVRPLEFTTIPSEYNLLWNIRKGLFPSVGAMRESGTTVIIEDVAFPVPRLAEATLDLQALFRNRGYHDAILFGHALEGNLHFVFKQDFNRAAEVERYGRFIEDVTKLVVKKYDGSLKAEHGTGRNMAPFVQLEWGAEAYELMQEIKEIFDPEGLLNPGVILNQDPLAHLRTLKPLPAAHPIIDKCIECGFCEVHCPSRNLTLTPRQRIVVYREMERLRSTGSNIDRLETLAAEFDYQGNQTCATDGLCATSCPVDIDTGKLIKEMRFHHLSPLADTLATLAANHMGFVTGSLRLMLNVLHAKHCILGTGILTGGARFLRWISRNNIPLWNPSMPKGADRLPQPSSVDVSAPAVVYFPTCINRTMGPAKGYTGEPSLNALVVRLLEKSGYRVILPEHLENLCCGMAFASKGFKSQGDRKARELQAALVKASANGTHPVLVDMSPCLYRMKEVFSADLKLYEPVRFVLDHLADRLEFRMAPETVAVHTTCSAEKMGLAGELRKVAELCAQKVVAPPAIGCCGWAGDRGFTYPELNASALQELRASLPADCTSGYSTSRTCEIGLSVHSGIPYRSILYLVDRCTAPKST
jgi:D-lactate dehydrogenase